MAPPPRFTRCGTQTSRYPRSRVWRSSMSWASARDSRAPDPHSTAKRDLAILAARSKSRMPRTSPTSQCGRGREAAEFPRRAPPADLDVLLGRAADRNARMGQVGKLQGERGQLGVDLPHLGIQGLDLVAELAALADRDRGILPAALGGGDRLGGAVPPGFSLLYGLEQRAALAVGAEELLERHLGAAVLDGLLDRVGMVTEEAGIKHSLPARLRRGPGCRRGRRGRGR